MPSRSVRAIFRAALAAGCVLSAWAGAQDLPDTLIDYAIEVTLDPETRRLEGTETVRWTNPSATTEIASVPLHLYLNAFAHEATTWMHDNALGIDVDSLLELHADPWGWNEPRSITQDGRELTWQPIAPDDGNPLDRSLIEVALAESIAPGETLELEIVFEARLPVPIARTGGFGDYFFVAQWFPKVAAFETNGERGALEDGWNAHQFHGPTEFYADYADFVVTIGMPAGWTVTATGRKAAESEGDGLTWHEFRQRAVHDFAFATARDYAEVVSTHDAPGRSRPIELRVFVSADRAASAGRWRDALTSTIDELGSRVGPYPYESIALVLPPYSHRATGGMEYPTLFTATFDDPIYELGPLRTVRLGEYVIAHEFTHQYFYGVIGSNEFEEAFLDEGFTEFWGSVAMAETYSNGLGSFAGRAFDIWHFGRAGIGGAGDRPPLLTRPSYLVPDLSLGAQFYVRPAMTLKTLENRFGRSTLEAIFSAYFEVWRFRHPRFEDFLAVARDVGGRDVADFIAEAFMQPSVPDYRIESLTVETWDPPRGRIVTADGVIEAEESRDELDALGARFAGTGDAIVVHRYDSGSVEDGAWARIERLDVVLEPGEPDPDWMPDEDAATFFESEVRLRGPGWDHLPVEVEFRFADGGIYRDEWDGRSTDRSYRFVEPVPLAEARIDPNEIVALDPNWGNNGRRREADAALAWDWAAWSAAVAQLVLEGFTQWL